MRKQKWIRSGPEVLLVNITAYVISKKKDKFLFRSEIISHGPNYPRKKILNWKLI